MNDESLLAAGGWTAPKDDVYSLAADAVGLTRAQAKDLMLPMMYAHRGGIHYPEPGSIEERLIGQRNEIVRLLSRRMAEKVHAAIEEACVIALENGWDVHVYRPPNTYPDDLALHRMAFVGIEFREGLYGVPTVHEHWHYEDPDWDDLD